MSKTSINILAWILLFILSFFTCLFVKDQEIIFETKSLNLKPHETIGVYDTQTKHYLGKSGWITGINFEVIGAPNSNLHHIVVANMNRQDWTCPDTFPERLHATAKELTPMILPKNYGYYVDKRERLASYVHLYNPTDTAYENVVVKIKISFLPFNFLRRLTNVQPIWLDIKNCTWDATVYINPKTKQILKQEYAYKMPFDARIVYAFGHLHNYGNKITITKNFQNLIEFNPFPNPENIEKIQFYYRQNENVLLESNDIIDIVAEYDNQLLKPIDAMGLGVVYLEKR